MVQSYRPDWVKRPKVVAAIPCFNATRFIGNVVAQVKKHVDQVIVVDDGSSDGTGEIARAAGALVITHKRKLGKGAAIQTAMRNTDADIIVTIDGDGQHDPEDIPGIIAPILHGEADLVIGSRHLADSRISSPSLTRRLTNVLASFIISVIISLLLPLATGLNRLIHPGSMKRSAPGLKNSTPRTKKWISDCTSGFRAIRKQSWQKLEIVSHGFQIETEMIYEAAKNKLVIAEVPISCNWNSHLSRLSILRDGLKTLRLLAKKLLDDLGKG